jgi:serine/threonine-protein kinase
MAVQAVPAFVKGRFDILQEIGEGGFARVFRARETATGREVALKVLKDAFVKDTEILERFQREVFAIASISSPHVVALYDFGITGQEVFLAMEYVEGPTLRDLLPRHTWTAIDIHLVVGQIAQALAAAHRQQIVHRDLKPENVMLVGTGGRRRVKVFDFGMAKIAELENKLELEPLTRVGTCFGTPQYMAPEVIRGQPFDHAVDLYALAVIAYELVGGLRPWDGGDPYEVMKAVLKKPLPRIAQASDPSVARINELNAFFTRALSKDRTARPGEAVAFFTAFESALFGEAAPPPSPSVAGDDQAFASVFARVIDVGAADTQVGAAPSKAELAAQFTADRTETGPAPEVVSTYDTSQPSPLKSVRLPTFDDKTDQGSETAEGFESARTSPASPTSPAPGTSVPTTPAAPIVPMPPASPAAAAQPVADGGASPKWPLQDTAPRRPRLDPAQLAARGKELLHPLGEGMKALLVRARPLVARGQAAGLRFLDYCRALPRSTVILGAGALLVLALAVSTVSYLLMHDNPGDHTVPIEDPGGSLNNANGNQ